MSDIVKTVLKVIAWIGLALLWVIIELVLLLLWSAIMAYSIGGWLPLLLVNALLVLAVVFCKKKNRSLLRDVAYTTIISIILSGVICWGWHAFESDFTTDKWINYPAGRGAMIDNLQEEHNMIGKTHGEIIDLLGEPETISQRLYGYETYEYYYGAASGRYFVNFDSNGKVSKVYNNFD